MGIALTMLAMLKLMDVPAFASSFLKDDLLSQRLPLYGRLYPGLELLVALLLGIAGMGAALLLAIPALA